jgi:hypothetical protein
MFLTHLCLITLVVAWASSQLVWSEFPMGLERVVHFASLADSGALLLVQVLSVLLCTHTLKDNEGREREKGENSESVLFNRNCNSVG